jgi:tol-pal system protein YbgF
MLKHLLAVALLATAPVLEAQVRVVESSPQGARPGATQSPSENPGNMAAEMYYQLQLLQQEVLELRGMMEEQAHEIKRLKQQRMDDYLDLDRRINALSGSAAAERHVDIANLAPTLSTTNQSIAEAEVYRAAYDLLRQRQVDQAIVAFNDHLSRFPRGDYAGNSYYWLGEIYLLRNDFPQAREWFSRLLQDFPDDRKVPDAKFKLGRVHHLEGDSERAKALLEEVASGTSDASRLARQYLRENF